MSASPASRTDDWRWTAGLIGALALVVSAGTIANGFAYDDRWIIETNNRVHDLHRWAEWFRTSYWPTQEASLYRPLTTAGFALQWAAGRGAPWVFHTVNVALYVAGAIAFAWVARMLLPATAALVVAALFAVHPVHVEAVANVVGQSELSAGLVMLLALGCYVRARRAGGPGRADRYRIAALYLVAVFLKEHAMVLPAWFLVAEVTLFAGDPSWGERVRRLTPQFALLTLVAVFALVTRLFVIEAIGGDIPHPALANLGMGARALVMLGVLPDMVRLMVFPARLFADYSPVMVTISPVPDPTQINGALIVLAALVLLIVAWRRSHTAAFGLLIAAAVWLPTANLLFPSGVLLAERTMYLPSAGVMLALGVLVAWVDARLVAPVRLRALGAAFAAVLVLGIGRSVTRARVWRSTEDVFMAMLLDEPESFRAHQVWGGVLFERGDLVGGERQWRMAIRIFPGYHKLYQDLAGRYMLAHRCEPAIPLYHKALELGGALPLSRAGLTACQLELARFHEARRTALLGIADGNDPNWFRARLKSADSALAARDSSR